MSPPPAPPSEPAPPQQPMYEEPAPAPQGQYPQQGQGQYPQQGPGQYPQQGPGQYPQQGPGQYPQQGPGPYHQGPPAAPPPEFNQWSTPRFDLGVTAGFNNPGGIVGLTSDVRLIDFLSVGLDAGFGVWGVRATPHVRLYPFGTRHHSLYVEGDLSLNFGTTATVDSTPIVQEFEPAAAVVLGVRHSWFRYFFTEEHIGWGFNLNPGAFHFADGSPVDVATANAMGWLEPGGFIIGGSVGFSFL